MTTGDVSGLCRCGCGEAAPLAKENDPRWGHVKGQPVGYIRGHNNRSTPLEYIEQNCGYVTPCWIWQRSISQFGYGVGPMTHGKRQPAHREIYERLVGPIPMGLELDHLCKVRACVRPSHLEPVTHTENVRRGQNTKITMHDALTIRRQKSAGVATCDLAQRYGITTVRVNQIARGVGWKSDFAEESYREIARSRVRGV